MSNSELNIILSESRNGRIVLAEDLGCFRVEFGNFILDKNYEELNLFFSNVQNCLIHISIKNSCPDRYIHFKTRDSDIRLRFSAYEIHELYDLLQNSILKYELNV